MKAIRTRSPKIHYEAHDLASRAGRLPMWVVCRPTVSDYPGKWTARMWRTLPEPMSTQFLLMHDTLEDLRGLLPPGLARLERNPDDDPVIEETWI